MKKILFRSITFITLLATVYSCGSSKNAAAAERKKQETKDKQDKLDQDQKRFEMQNNKDIK